MTTTPANGNEPHRPHADGPLAPTAPGTTPTEQQPLTKAQKILTGIVVGAVLVIATLGFIGSYAAVTDLAKAKHFGKFAHAFPIAVDAGIIAFLALDLLLTWRRIPYPLLRYTAWGLTAATIAFNAVVSWPDPVGTGMHGVIPILFVIAVEAARHAIGRIAEIVADKHIEGPNPSRWLLNPVGTFVLWRRQRLWGIRKWDTVLNLERERRIYIGKLRKEHGRWAWRRKATADQVLVLSLAKDGMSVTDAIALPAREEEKRRQEEDRIAREKQDAADKRHREQEEYDEQKRREADEYKREQQRLEDERRREQEDERLDRERKAREQQQAQEEADRQRELAQAEHRAQLEEIARQQRAAADEDERRQRQEQLEHARRVAAEQERAAEAARRVRQNEEAAARAAAEKEAASRRAAEIVQRAASATPAPASRPASASRTVASQPANAATTPAANAPAGSASATSTASANEAATSPQAANANASQSTATSTANGASGVDISEVVDVYQLLKEKDGKAPSDATLGQALGVSRSRAQQLRTLAVEAGHAELAKPMRLAS
ncbi:DUF2637 domain-containing protein [Streptomyces sp. NPDC046862]|uniref:DUF2637 domain-containing protein n=1 Tax=Streptomyces sp. NPDC046862 TaxID=3154603 RepID=UPI003452E4D4